MNVLFDSQIFSFQKFGGISRYFVELMSHLPQDITPINSILFSDNEYLKKSNLKSKGIIIPSFKGKQRIVNPANKWFSEIKIKQNRFNVFHPTYYDPYFLKHLRKPYILTVYDMTHEIFNKNNITNNSTIRNKKLSLQNAEIIIAISENTKKDIIDIYNIPEDKIRVIYLGYSANTHKQKIIRDLPNSYILFVGQRNGYKNFERLLKAFAKVKQSHPEIHLVCTGSELTSSEHQLIASLNLSDRIKHFFATDTELNFLYRNALCFIYPSLYEGFGIPILEAFASKCPLVLSNTSCFPEIAGDGGLYFDPLDIDSIHNSIIRIIEDEELKLSLTIKGCEQLKKYNWGNMAIKTAELYRNFE